MSIARSDRSTILDQTAAEDASDYFNSLPIEERKKLAPLLEDYRRLGIMEALAAMNGVTRQLAARSRSIETKGWDRP